MNTGAPTGSGKTVLFELAIIRMLMESSKNSRASKCIYVAPTKVKSSRAVHRSINSLAGFMIGFMLGEISRLGCEISASWH
jgi:superfamily II DNA/RNA helicase